MSYLSYARDKKNWIPTFLPLWGIRVRYRYVRAYDIHDKPHDETTENEVTR